MQIVFAHGWAHNRFFFQSLADKFTCKTILWDAGYYGDYQQENPEVDGPKIGIGHSLGFKKLIESDLNFDLIIGLQSFINFLGNSEQLQKIRRRAFLRLQKNFQHSPQECLEDFLLESKELCNFNNLNLGLLDQDLLACIEITALPDLPVLIIGSEDDQIVPKELILDNFNNKTDVEFLQKGGHLLGYHYTEQVYQLTIRYINSVFTDC